MACSGQKLSELSTSNIKERGPDRLTRNKIQNTSVGAAFFRLQCAKRHLAAALIGTFGCQRLSRVLATFIKSLSLYSNHGGARQAGAMTQPPMTQPLPPRLHLPAVLERQLWQHARREWPQECVGVLGGVRLAAEQWQARTLYPLLNVAADSGREYLAHGPHFLRALGAMRAGRLELVAIYHSHPYGPPTFSRTDQARAAYDVPHLIADLSSSALSAFLLPEGRVCLLGR